MSVREFAAHLGVNDAAVSNWERRGTAARLRYDTQQLLDADLEHAGSEVVNRFRLLLQTNNPAGPAPTEMTHNDHPLGAEPEPFAERSRERTAVLLRTVRTDFTETGYLPDEAAFDRFRQFLESHARVFVLAGPAGTGKTRLTQYFAERWSERVAFQLHTCASWGTASVELAAEVLRYASMSSKDDPLLNVENASRSLDQPCVIVIDGIDSEQQLDAIGRHVDSLLRQVESSHLRFLLVARTPLQLDLSPFPVLAAVTFDQASTTAAPSYTMRPWDLAEARQLWDRLRDNEIPFTALPEPVQALARTPLYMQMLLTTGQGDTGLDRGNGVFPLVDHCVRTLLNRSALPTDTTIEHLARIACDLTPDAVPEPLLTRSGSETGLLADSFGFDLAFVEQASDGSARFTHDIFREYFLAIRIVDEVKMRGRSAATVAVFNELASRATESASARGLFDFVVYALGSAAPNLLDAIALAPSIALDTTLPILLETSAAQGVPVSADVYRTSAQRCAQIATKQLSRALLASPNLPAALDDRYAPWVVGQLRTYGSELWGDLAHHVEQTLDVRISTRLLDGMDLDRAEDAVFVARHFDLFSNTAHDEEDLLQRLLVHLDWRVRAGLAESLLRGGELGRARANRIVDHLVRDDDYKVRAAVARSIGVLDAPLVRNYLQVLLTDRNWHVRERTLLGVLTGTKAPLPDPPMADTVIGIVSRDASWTNPPSSTAKLLARIRLLNIGRGPDTPASADVALFGVLREVRSGWLELPAETERFLTTRGESSSDWLTAREARAVAQRHASPPAGSTVRERFRRRRGRRALQIALDVHSLDRALHLTRAAVDADVDFLEVGDPLIKRTGVEAITAIRRTAPNTTVVAEMMSADWGRDQVELAAEAGADVVLLIGPASIASVSAAVAAARRLEVALVLDVPPQHVHAAWLRDMERTGVDGFVVTTNIDLGVGSNHPLATAKTIRSCSQLPVAVSGGFSTADDALIASTDWDIAIVGRSIADAVSPSDIAHELSSLIRKIRAEESQ
ncbi:orotidine 5'-phosphate decarboxylase / HUMPS family protein [Nocardia sp. NPDC004068]|uniref:orotidine 5'-phosphate decarboxylase / HUMPS family protein n=1 Tax=Nocardia sp. NPDC004068 TaxID=3364303 RepID=UPI00369AAFE8